MTSDRAAVKKYNCNSSRLFLFFIPKRMKMRWIPLLPQPDTRCSSIGSRAGRTILTWASFVDTSLEREMACAAFRREHLLSRRTKSNDRSREGKIANNKLDRSIPRQSGETKTKRMGSNDATRRGFRTREPRVAKYALCNKHNERPIATGREELKQFM